MGLWGFDPPWDATVEAESFTVDTFRDAADSIFRDFGRYGHHSKRCVYLKDDKGLTKWCCADDCRMRRRVSDGND